MLKLSLRRLARLASAAGALALGACGGSTGPADAPAYHVVLSDTAVSVRVGDNAAVSAHAKNAAGQDLAGRAIFWSSRDTTVATVTQAGVIRGVAPGTTQISASAEGQSAVATVAVLARPITSLVVDPATTQLAAGASQRLTARVTNDAGTPVATAVTWTSLDPGVVRVTSDGLVTALTPGVGSVRATADSLSGVAVVVVTRVPVASVRVTPATATLTPGATQQLAAAAYDAAGNALTGRDAAWSSRDPGIAAVSSTGQVTAIAPGTATVNATVEGQVASATITVRPAPVAKVTVSPASGSVGIGGTVGLTAATLDANGTPLTGRLITWTSATPAVARVDANGTVTGVAPGTTTVTATSEGVSGAATVQVVAPAAAVTSVSVNPASATLAVGGGTRTFVATPRASDGTALTGRTVTWSSSATGVATVSSAGGVVAPVAPGTATITATVDGITGTATVLVQPPPVATVVVSPPSSTIAAGANAQLAASTRDASGNVLTGRLVTWTSSNTAVAAVTSGGRVTGTGPGTATITATSEGASGTATVTVTAVVVISPNPVTIRDRGQPRTAQLAATDQNNHVLPSSEVTWASSDPSIATVDATGLVRAVSSQGNTATATITATYRGATGTATVTVTK